MTMNILDEITMERARQDVIWGGPAHDDGHTNEDFLSYIIRQLGRIGCEVTPERVKRRAFIKAAALSVAAVERIDRAAASRQPPRRRTFPAESSRLEIYRAACLAALQDNVSDETAQILVAALAPDARPEGGEGAGS